MGLLGTAALLQWRQIDRVEETAALVARTHEVQANLNRLVSLALEVAVGARAFALTGEPMFLKPFEANLEAVAEQQRSVEQLILSDEQKANLSTLESLIARRIAASRRVVELRQNAGFEAARQLVASGEGEALMDAVRAQLVRMDVTDQTLLGQRAAAARREANAAARLSLSVAGLGAALFIAMFALALRENRLRQRTQVQLAAFSRSRSTCSALRTRTDISNG